MATREVYTHELEAEPLEVAEERRQLQTIADELVAAVDHDQRLDGLYVGSAFVEMVSATPQELREIADYLEQLNARVTPWQRGYLAALRVGADDREEGRL